LTKLPVLESLHKLPVLPLLTRAEEAADERWLRRVHDLDRPTWAPRRYPVVPLAGPPEEPLGNPRARPRPR